MRRGRLLFAACALVACARVVMGADLTIGSYVLSPASTETVVVSGDIAGESTFGVSIMVEIVPQAGTTGTVSFSPAPPTDITQLGDAWPGVGTFSTFDTDTTTALTLNGCVDDNGTYIAGAVTFSGELAGFPVVASADASGTWDLLLSTSLGDSSWEGLSTNLSAGTLTVESGACNDDPDCADNLFCNGVEQCVDHVCVSGSDPCPGALCDENLNACVECLIEKDCMDALFCNEPEVCNNGVCEPSGTEPCPGQLCDEEADQCVDCIDPADCDDGAFCNGEERCVGGACLAGSDPCPGQACNEDTDTCVPCQNDNDCDDGLFCNGQETCDVDACVAGTDPCPDQGCDEVADACTAAAATLAADQIVMTPGATAAVTVSGDFGGADTYGVSILIELVPQGGNAGTLTFTTSPPADITQVGDPWPGLGTFSPYDTADTGSSMLNGAVDDNGTFLPGALTFAGNLASFPVLASSDADGVWDVVLSTSLGDSSWEGVPTTLTAGTVTVAPATWLGVVGMNLSPGTTGDLVVAGDIDGESTYGVTILAEIIPRAGNTGTVTFTSAPPADIEQAGDMWPGLGGFTVFDTDSTGSNLLNGCVDDNGSFIPEAVTFAGPLARFPVAASGTASGVWDVVLATSSGDSGFEDVPTAQFAGTITVTPSAVLSVRSLALPPGNTGTVLVRGAVDGDATYGATVLVELVPRAGATGTVTFTPAPPSDVVELDDPWPDIGGFTGFDTDDTASLLLNGAVTDNGTFLPAPLEFAGDLVEFPVVTSGDADGVWDLMLTTSAGASGWEGVTTGLTHGTLTVTADACLLDSECNDDNRCTTDTCEVGLCVNAPNTLTCDDGLRCTVSDVCTDGTCSGTPLDCTHMDSGCTQGVCNPLSGECRQTIVNEGLPCDDNAPCTENDTCTAGVCSGTMRDCSHLDGQCVQGWCRPFDGACIEAFVNAGLTCNDGDVCTSDDVCRQGQCVGTPLDACLPCFEDIDCNDNNACTDEFCHPAGVCIYPFNEDPCDDGTLCTVDDVCIDGECIGTRDVSCRECLRPTDCLDGNVCTDDVCAVVQIGQQPICQNPNNTVPCDDGDLCTSNDACADGVCEGLQIPNCASCEDDEDCDDGNPCSSDTCHPTLSVCVNLLLPDDTECTDDDPCTDSEVCVGGVCVGNPMADDAPCDDGNACTSDTICLAGMCTDGNTVDCSAMDDDCNVGTCDPETGACSPQPANEGGGCTANCIAVGQCVAGVCELVEAVDCTSLDSSCTLGTCDPATGACEADPIHEGESCDDGNTCSLQDTCVDGTCAGIPVDCTAFDDDCNQGVCNPVDGSCAPTPINEGNTCDDANPCTENDTCASGVCGGTDRDCSAIDSDCVVGVCDPDDGSCGPEPINEGGNCDDGELCTINNVCSRGVCVGDVVDCSALNDTCNIAACNSMTGDCEQTPINEGGDCDDGNPCTLRDECSGGTCTGVPRDCSALVSYCSDATCNVDTGQCEATPIREGETCDDGLPCTTGDTCINGVCVGSGGESLVQLSLSATPTEELRRNPIYVSLIATATTCQPQEVGSLDVVLTWDPTHMALTSIRDTGPYNWPIYGFPNDSALDGLNAPYDGTIANDGDAYYSAAAEFLSGATVDSTGIVVATFEFTAIAGTSGTPTGINIEATIGDTDTMVLQAHTGIDITGGTSNTSVQVIDCDLDAHCADDNVCTDDSCQLGATRQDNVCMWTNNTLACDDGLYCTATDICEAGICEGSGDTCDGNVVFPYCTDVLDDCVKCLNAFHCDDGLYCTGVEYCDDQGPVSECLDPVGQPDGPDLPCCKATGNPCDYPDTCSDATSMCGCEDPVVEGLGARFLGITTAPSALPRGEQWGMAIEISSAAIACMPKYVNPVGRGFGELVDDPVFLPQAEWGTIIARGLELVPSTTYSVKLILQRPGDLAESESASISAATSSWGDICGATYEEPPNGVVNLTDVLYVLDAQTTDGGLVSESGLYPADLHDCIPNGIVNLTDIIWVLDAQASEVDPPPYPCPDPCS